MVTSGKPVWCNGSTLACNGRDVGSIHALGTIFPIFTRCTTLVLWPGSCTSCMVVEPTLYKVMACMYLIVELKTYNSKGTSGLHWPLRQWAAYKGRCGYSGEIRELMWCNGSTLAQNARDVGSIPAPGPIFPIFITPTTVAIPVQLTKWHLE